MASGGVCAIENRTPEIQAGQSIPVEHSKAKVKTKKTKFQLQTQIAQLACGKLNKYQMLCLSFSTIKAFYGCISSSTHDVWAVIWQSEIPL